MSVAATATATLFPWLAWAAESDELDAKASSLQQDLSSKQAEANELSARLETMQQRLNEALERFNAATKAHNEAEEKKKEAEEALKAAEERLAELQDQLSRRASSMYREDNLGILDVLFGSATFDEFATNWDAMRRIGENDAELVSESKEVRAECERARDEYTRQEAAAAAELEKATTAKAEVETAQAELQAEYDAMSSDIAAIQAEIEQVRMDANTARQREQESRAAAQRAIYGTASGSSNSSTPSVSVSGWVNPAPGKYITSGFGYRSFGGYSDYHQGVDLSCRYEPVYAMAAGTVTHSGWFGTGGMAVIINHGGGIVSWYLHGSQLNVVQGQSVSAGQQIMISGNTGFSTGAHLHFQINVNSADGIYGTAVNPTAYFRW